MIKYHKESLEEDNNITCLSEVGIELYKVTSDKTGELWDKAVGTNLPKMPLRWLDWICC